MVCVAAIALGSSTYAWFVSNNNVKATTANISAQSNAPFLMIDKDSIKENSGTSIEFGTTNTKLCKMGDPQSLSAGDWKYPQQSFWVQVGGWETYRCSRRS